jgi:hypothetical protein
MYYLRYLPLFAYSGVQHILCCVFHRLVYPMFSWIVRSSVFSNVYVASLSGLSVLRFSLTFM